MRYSIFIALLSMLSCNNNANTTNAETFAGDTTAQELTPADSATNAQEEELEEVVDVLKTVPCRHGTRRSPGARCRARSGK